MILSMHVFWMCVFWSLSHSYFPNITFAKIRFLSLSLAYINVSSHRNQTCNYGNISKELRNIGEKSERIFFSKQMNKGMYFYSWYLLAFYYFPVTWIFNLMTIFTINNFQIQYKMSYSTPCKKYNGLPHFTKPQSKINHPKGSPLLVNSKE